MAASVFPYWFHFSKIIHAGDRRAGEVHSSHGFFCLNGSSAATIGLKRAQWGDATAGPGRIADGVRR